MKQILRSAALITTALSYYFTSSAFAAQNAKTNLFDRPKATSAPSAGASLFGDTVVAKAKGFEVRQSQIDEMYMAFKGHRAAMGQEIPDGMRSKIEADILNKIIATQIIVRRATDQDKVKAKQIADEFIADQKHSAPSEDSYKRQLLAVGMSTAEFESQIREQAIVKAVIDREIKTTKTVTDAEAKKFYTDNPALFQEPELVRAAHILISTHDPVSGKDYTPELKLQKKRLTDSLVTRARKGEDFGKLVKEFSEDARTKTHGGEYTFPRAKDDPARAMVPEFEAAAFSMSTNQVSDVVETRYGYHIIKVLEKVPAKKIEYTKVEARIKDTLLRDAVERALPDYIEKLKKEAGVEILVTANSK